MALTSCRRRMLPKDLPPFIGMPNYFYAWRDIGVLGAIHNKIILVTREQAAGGGEPIRQSQRQQVRQDCKHHIATDTSAVLLALSFTMLQSKIRMAPLRCSSQS